MLPAVECVMICSTHGMHTMNMSCAYDVCPVACWNVMLSEHAALLVLVASGFGCNGSAVAAAVPYAVQTHFCCCKTACADSSTTHSPQQQTGQQHSSRAAPMPSAGPPPRTGSAAAGQPYARQLYLAILQAMVGAAGLLRLIALSSAQHMGWMWQMTDVAW